MLPGPPDQTEKVVRVGRDSDRLRKDSINTRAFGVERAAVEVEVTLLAGDLSLWLFKAQSIEAI